MGRSLGRLVVTLTACTSMPVTLLADVRPDIVDDF